MSMIVNSCADLPIKKGKAAGRRRWPPQVSFSAASPVKTRKAARSKAQT